MGNESSLPTDPASGALTMLGPPNNDAVQEGPATAAVDHPSNVEGQQSLTPRSSIPRPGARMIGAVFGKGKQAQQQQQQNASGHGSIEEDVKRPASNNPFYNLSSSNNNNPGTSAAGHYNNLRTDSTGSASSNYYDASMGHPPYNMNGDVVTSHDYFAQAQQQNYYASQQQQQQSYYTQQQTAGYPNQQQHSMIQQQPHDHHSSSIEDVEHKEHPAVGIMYEKTAPQAGSKKSLFAPAGRASVRGAGLISSMRNLTLAGAFKGVGSAKKDANEWEKQWDADNDDDEDSSEEDDNDRDDVTAFNKSGKAEPTSNHTYPVHHHHQQPQQIPAMDVGHSDLPLQHLSRGVIPTSSSPLTRFDSNNNASTPMATMPLMPTALGPPHSALVSDASNKMVAQSPFGFTAAPGASLQQRHDLASEWDMAGIQPPTAYVPGEGEASETSLATPQQEQDSTKPDVTMFLPMLRVLGKGSFGKVVLVQKRQGKERGALFAMKILRKTHLVKRRQIERTRTERKVLSVVNHPFIMKLHYAFQTPDKLYLVLDYCPGGELFFHLSRFRRFPERVARFYAAELLLAIGHLHKRGIIYRDLKPENVLLDADGHVKLGDFGLAKAGIKHPCEGAISMCGTPEYMAPEVLAQAGHGFCVDYWGLGMLLYEMMTGLPPWYTTDRAKLFRRLKSAPLDIPSYFSVQAAHCVGALLERNPRRRLGVTGIRNSMEHEFFRNISWKSLYARRVEAPIKPCEGWKPPEAAKDGVSDDKIVAQYGGPLSLTDIERIDPGDLDAATANFDNTFTRMPVESEELGPESEHTDESEAADQLNDETFLGFSFDSKDREAAAAAAGHPLQGTGPPLSPRVRSHVGPTFQPQQHQTL